jgi:hypothetical protein
MLKKVKLLSAYISVGKRGDNVSIHTKPYGWLYCLTAVLLKIQVFCDVTLLLCLYYHNNITQYGIA